MPKDNTKAQGTEAGFAVLLASTGLLGLAGFVYWLAALWRSAATSHAPRGLRMAVLAVAVCGFATPLFVGPILLPLGVLHTRASHGAPDDA